MKELQPINSDEYVNEKGQLKKGNPGKPKGATNTTNRELKQFITTFLNDKAEDLPTIWNALSYKDRASLFLNLSRLVIPRTPIEIIEQAADKVYTFDFDN